ncbi:MAG: asparaginase [Marinifilaceae bacterium]
MKKKVLIIYTGGTIGMVNDPETGALCPFNFEAIMNAVPELKEFEFGIDSYTLPKIIDSSDISPEVWRDICNIIVERYEDYCGFVVLHGTDTMAYSASAVSFMLDNLAKPVVFTGSQLPIGTIRTDGRENLIAALEIAAATMSGRPVVPEVTILFGDKLFRGNRASKVDAESFDAFKSFNYPPLAEIGIHILYNYEAIDYSYKGEKITAHSAMDSNVTVLKLFPGMSAAAVDGILNTPGLRGVIMESFGSGNAPSNPEFLQKIRLASEKGILIYNVTQCQGGSVEMGRYATSQQLASCGVLSGYDITTEAAVCKMMYLLGRYSDTKEVKKYLNRTIKGEISVKRIAF